MSVACILRITINNKTLHHYAWGKYKNISLPPVNVFNKICYYARNDVPYSYKNKPFRIIIIFLI